MDKLLESALNAAALRPDPKRKVKCLGPECPVAKGECDKDGECYLWRCMNPHAPKPEQDDVAEFAGLVLKVNASRRIG